MDDLRLQEVAEFDGEGLLTCLCVYEGTCYVGCEDGDAGLYTVSGSAGFAAVTLPLDDDADTAYVQELAEWDGDLWAFGWQVALDADGEVDGALPCVWGYGGSTWTLRAVSEDGSDSLRWANVAGGDTSLHGGLFSGGSAGGWEATLRDGTLEEDTSRQVRAVAMLGDTPVRIWRASASGAWQLEDVADLTPEVPSTDPDWGDWWHPLQPMATWQGRVWVMALVEGRQQLYSTRGDNARPGPSWLRTALGRYDTMTVWQNRLWLFGVDVEEDGAPVYGVWDPPGMALARSAGGWRVRHARAFDGDLWALGTKGHDSEGQVEQPGWVLAAPGANLYHSEVSTSRSPVGLDWFLTSGSGDVIDVSSLSVTAAAGDAYEVSGAWESEVNGRYVRDGTWWGLPRYRHVNGRYTLRQQSRHQAVLLQRGTLLLDALEVQWGDGLGANVPTLARAEVEWSREYPTEATLISLEAQWSDGSGSNTPTLGRLEAHWSDGRAINQPTLERLEAAWGKGGDARPGLASITAQWGDGLGGNLPTLLSLAAEWRVPLAGLKRPRLDSVTIEHGDGSGENTPTLTSLEAYWGDGLGANTPALSSLAAHWSLGWEASRPALSSLEAHWGDHEPRPPRSAARVSMVKVEWGNSSDPTGGGEDILWLTHTADADVVGVRVVTSAVMEEGRDLDCLIRTDDSPDVDAWHTYQRFRSNRTVVVDEPGADLRIGIAKDPSIADETDVFVQFKFDE